MHGLIFNTSIWLLAGSTRYPIPTLYNSQTPQKAFLFCSSECFLTSCCAVALSQTLTPVLCKATNTPTTHQLSFHSQHHHYYVYHGVPTTTTLFPCFCGQVTHQLCDPLYKSKKRKSIEAKETTDWLVTSGRDTLCQVPLLCPSFYPP